MNWKKELKRFPRMQHKRFREEKIKAILRDRKDRSRSLNKNPRKYKQVSAFEKIIAKNCTGLFFGFFALSPFPQS